jgi:hypothetical protein
MIRKLVPWTVAFATRLLLARSITESGVDPITGAPAHVPNAAMWPPHRPRPTFSRKVKRDNDDLVRMAVVGGRVTFAERTKLVGGKGLRP